MRELFSTQATRKLEELVEEGGVTQETKERGGGMGAQTGAQLCRDGDKRNCRESRVSWVIYTSGRCRCCCCGHCLAHLHLTAILESQEFLLVFLFLLANGEI